MCEIKDPTYLEAVNSSIKKVERPKPLADVSGVSNPSMYRCGPFGVRAAKYTDGTICFEVADETLTHGGVAWVKESDMPVTYTKFVKYGDSIGNRMMRICKSSRGGDALRIVIGKHNEENKDKFVKIVYEIELDVVTAFDLLRFNRMWEYEVHLRVKAQKRQLDELRKTRDTLRAMRTGSSGVPLPEDFLAMMFGGKKSDRESNDE